MPFPHVCPGAACPHLVNTGESWVCALTGVCVENVVVAGYDYVASSSAVVAPKGSEPVAGEIYECKTKQESKPREHDKKEDVYGECYRVVEKLLGKENKIVNKKNSGAIRNATKKAHAVFKKKVDKNNRTRLLPAISEFLQAFKDIKKTGGGAFKEKKIEGVARRCQKCCELSLRRTPTSATVKIKIEYLCVAAVYLLREGLTVKGVEIAEKDEEVRDALPNLNSLDSFGFSKSKYTKAERFVRDAIQRTIYEMPIHSINF